MHTELQHNVATIKQVSGPKVILSQTYYLLYRLISQGALDQQQLEVTDTEVSEYIDTGFIPSSINTNYYLNETLKLIESSTVGVDATAIRKNAIINFMKVARRLKLLLFRPGPAAPDLETGLEIVQSLIQEFYGEDIKFQVLQPYNHFRLFEVVVYPENGVERKILVKTSPEKQIFLSYDPRNIDDDFREG